MKLASIFFKTNGSILERQLKDTKKTNEKYEAKLQYFSKRTEVSWSDSSKIRKRQTRNMKFTSIFFNNC